LKIQAFWLFLEGLLVEMVAKIQIWLLIIVIMTYLCYCSGTCTRVFCAGSTGAGMKTSFAAILGITTIHSYRFVKEV